MMTKQQVLQRVFDHFVKDGNAPAYDDENGGSCVYRGDGNDCYSTVRCAMGIFIPDNLYHPAMESNPAAMVVKGIETERMDGPLFTASLTHLFTEDVYTGSGYDEGSTPFINQVQHIHDELAMRFKGQPADFRWQMAMKLANLATEHGITLTS